MKFIEKNSFVKLLNSLKIEYFHCSNPYEMGQDREYLTVNVQNVGDFVSDIFCAISNMKVCELVETLEAAQEAFNSMVLDPNEGNNSYTMRFIGLEYKEDKNE